MLLQNRASDNEISKQNSDEKRTIAPKSNINEAIEGKYINIREKSQIKFISTAKMLGINSAVPGKFTEFSIVGTRFR